MKLTISIVFAIATAVFAYLYFTEKNKQKIIDIKALKEKYPLIDFTKEEGRFIKIPILLNDTGIIPSIFQPRFYRQITPEAGTSIATSFRRNHRLYGADGSNGEYFITYSPTTILNYINNVYNNAIRSHRALGGDSTWQVGFYPVEKIDSRTGGLIVDFVVIPAIVPNNGQSGGGVDYFGTSSSAYNKSIIKPYDFGNMHP